MVRTGNNNTSMHIVHLFVKSQKIKQFIKMVDHVTELHTTRCVHRDTDAIAQHSVRFLAVTL